MGFHQVADGQDRRLRNVTLDQDVVRLFPKFCVIDFKPDCDKNVCLYPRKPESTRSKGSPDSRLNKVPSVK
jgi:hypothetical protein